MTGGDPMSELFPISTQAGFNHACACPSVLLKGKHEMRVAACLKILLTLLSYFTDEESILAVSCRNEDCSSINFISRA